MAEEVSSFTDFDSPLWREPPSAVLTRDTFGVLTPNHRTEVRARWNREFLYFFFTSAYEKLHLRPSPATEVKTQGLWHWDVAEVFIGSDFQHIGRYREFELSPQGEWLDIAVDLDQEDHPKDWLWNSGMAAAAHISAEEKLWYGSMRIPYSSIDVRPAEAGNRLRVNFFRSQGPSSAYREIAWQPTNQATFHVPESFGILELLAPLS